jgi:hypothetical protein
MTLDPDLVYRILLAIEAKETTAPARIQIANANRQDVLNHLAALHEEGLYSGPKPHRSSSTGEVDQALVRDLTPLGRERLQQIKQEQQDLSARSSAWGNSWGSSWGRPPGVQAQGAAGTINVSTEDPYSQLQARVVLLESSVQQLRSALATSSTGVVGMGHNQGPEFAPVPIEDLQWADDLVALLKAQGPTPPADLKPLMEKTEKAVRLGEMIENGLLSLGAELAKGAAREVGKELLASHWAAVCHWIGSVYRALSTWLGGREPGAPTVRFGNKRILGIPSGGLSTKSPPA